MSHVQNPTPTLYELTSLIDACETCDPEFDAVYEDLDCEFPHLRRELDATDGGVDA